MLIFIVLSQILSCIQAYFWCAVCITSFRLDILYNHMYEPRNSYSEFLSSTLWAPFDHLCWVIWKGPQSRPLVTLPPRLPNKGLIRLVSYQFKDSLIKNRWYKMTNNRVKLKKYTPPDGQFLGKVREVDPLTVCLILTAINQPEITIESETDNICHVVQISAKRDDLNILQLAHSHMHKCFQKCPTILPWRWRTLFVWGLCAGNISLSVITIWRLWWWQWQGWRDTEEGLRGQKELLTTGPQSQTAAASSCIVWTRQLSLHFVPKTDTWYFFL